MQIKENLFYNIRVFAHPPSQPLYIKSNKWILSLKEKLFRIKFNLLKQQDMTQSCPNLLV